jgi:PAS domain S-box-containing protein
VSQPDKTENTQNISTQQGLPENEERCIAALEIAGAGVLDWKIQTGEMFFSDRWRLMTGYHQGDIGETVDSLKALVHPDDLPVAQADLQRVLDNQAASHNVEHRLKCADGQWIWVESRSLVTRRAPDGTPLRMVGTHTDITARKEAEEKRKNLDARLLDGQKIESLGVLAAGVAQQFNNLLIGILGYSDLALPHIPDNSPARPFITEVIAEANRAADLTLQLLKYAGKARAPLSNVDLSTLLRELRPALESSISNSKKIVIDHDLPALLPPVQADPVQIRQIIMSLAHNAAEAIGDDNRGTIRVEAGIQHCDAEVLIHSVLGEDCPPGAYVYIRVTDDGCGMSDATKRKSFDPFFTTKSAGRGLSLSAVLGIMRAHRGVITCSSELGQGTSIAVFFPPATSSTASNCTRCDRLTKLGNRALKKYSEMLNEICQTAAIASESDYQRALAAATSAHTRATELNAELQSHVRSVHQLSGPIVDATNTQPPITRTNTD